MVQALAHGGWNLIGWPSPVGVGGDVRHRAIFYDELVRAGLPVPESGLLLETLGPAILHAAPTLAAELLPAFVTGREWWGQGFSEPEAGSDLAALRCRARRDGDSYVLDGQKLWTSHGATASRVLCLVRTGEPSERHRGLTMLLVDADTPGFTRRPVALASGQNELAELYFDQVRVPASRLVGSEGGGWAVTMYLMQFERAMFAWQNATTALARLEELGASPEARSLGDGFVSRFGQVYADIITLRARAARTVRVLGTGGSVGPEASVDKITLATVESSLYDLARDVLGARFAFDADLKGWRDEWWYSRSATILGGSSEIQRTILADHVLRLPKEGS
jgi:alkylation response protein AidB-like acyl-CoA dehydrogenase